VLRAVAAAQLADEPTAEAEEAYAFLLDVRDELRRRSGRPTDVLVRQEQRPIAVALGLPDEDALLREVSLAGRRLAFVADETWRRVEAALVRRPRARYRRVRREPAGRGRRPPGRRGRASPVTPARPPTPAWCCAARPPRRGRTCCCRPYTLKVLAVHSPPVPEPWPAEVRWSFLRVLASGRSGGRGPRAAGPGGAAVPAAAEWDRVRSLPQRHPWHRFTVDRHLVEAAAAAAELTRDVDRPDLLLVGALLHDIGKGWPGDHSEVGEPITARIATRMGFAEADVATLAAMVRHHLLLPDTATRRDIDDPATIDRVAATIGHDPALLQLLHALAQADGAATSSSAWSPWKAHLVAALVARVQARLGGSPVPEPEPVLHPGEPQVSTDAPADAVSAISVGVEDVADGQQVTIVAPDRHGLFSHLAGVLALNQLDVRAAKVNVVGTGPRRLRRPAAVRAGAGALDPGRRRAGALEGRCRWPSGSAAGGRLPAGRRPGDAAADLWHNGEVTGDATGIVEVRAGDRAGLLYRLTAALATEGLDVTSARDRDPRRRRRRPLLRLQTPRGSRSAASSGPGGGRAERRRPRCGARPGGRPGDTPG
jgi:[protein-PII] uridylyltransferase